MKRTKHISYLIHAFIALALIGTASACVEYQGPNSAYGTNGKLSVKGIVSEATVITRAGGTTPSVETLKEKELNTLDVFVEHVTNGTGDGTFIRQYHLPFPVTEGDPAAIQEGANNLLAEHWVSEGLVIGEKYNIYVATNNTQTKDTKDLSTFNVAKLKELVADEVTDGKALIDVYDNIAAPWSGAFSDTPSGNIYKQYISDLTSVRTGQYNSVYGFTDDKEFMMDGVINNWTPDPTKMDQVFDVTLNRAAAKFVLNVKFDADFLESLEEEDVSIVEKPGWRFYNFAFGAPVFTPAEQGDGVEVHNSGTMLLHPYEYEGTDRQFKIITYSYPNKWESTNYATEAPSLVITVMYSDSNDPHYYRIPLVESTVTAIERNHIYVINATIATRGSDVHEDIDEIKDVYYQVLPWNDETNSDVIENNVESIQHYYFRANPKVYTLRGDGNQSVIINYSKATGTKVNWKLFTYDDDGNQTGVVANNATNAVRAWFYDSNGDFTTTYSDTGSGITWGNTMGVKIEQSTEITSGTKGTVTVTSTALTNKAIKYIRLRVYLDEQSTFQNGKETMYEDIIIRHFPTDNIQNIEGLWSSYSGTTSTVTRTTTDLAEAEEWANQYGVTVETETIPQSTEYIDYSTYYTNASDTDHYHMEGPTPITMELFQQMIQGNSNRRDANSQANAKADSGEGHSYYWGTDPTTVTGTGWPYYNPYDYYTRRYLSYTYYKYTNYYTATYTHTIDSYTLYTVTYTTETPSTWVDWEDRESHSPQRTLEYSYGGNGSFIAKIYSGGVMHRFREDSDGGLSGTYTTNIGNTNNLGGLNNNHMYVIQISSTSNSYVLGRPYVNETTHQSQDNVVSPAFMIASQLGAVTQFTGNNAAANAATHCSRYMEVTEGGKRYKRWRLPTQAEIAVISGYQNGNINNVTIPSAYRVIAPVLTGNLYWCLSGNKIRTSDNQIVNNGNAYLRCVRDLSADEVKELNGFEDIVDKYNQD